MAKVTVRLYADLRAATGKDEVIVEATSVKDLIDTLVKRFGTDLKEALLNHRGRLEQFYRVYLNKKLVPESELEKTRLRDGDLVQIFPPVSGGCERDLRNLKIQRRQSI